MTASLFLCVFLVNLLACRGSTYDDILDLAESTSDLDSMDWSSFSLAQVLIETFSDSLEPDEMEVDSDLPPDSCIGVGTTAEVWLVHRLDKNGQVLKVAEKRMPIVISAASIRPFAIIEEIQALKIFQECEIFPRFYDFDVVGDEVHIRTEYIPGKTLESIINRTKPNPLGETLARRFGANILEAIKFLNSKGLVHCDIAPRNIIVTPGGIARLIDLGFVIESGGTHEVRDDCPLITWAPEVRNGQMTTASDVWSWGTVMCEMVTGDKPYNDLNSSLIKRSIFRVPLPARSIILSCFVREPTARAKVAELLEHSYFRTRDEAKELEAVNGLKDFLEEPPEPVCEERLTKKSIRLELAKKVVEQSSIDMVLDRLKKLKTKEK